MINQKNQIIAIIVIGIFLFSASSVVRADSLIGKVAKISPTSVAVTDATNIQLITIPASFSLYEGQTVQATNYRGMQIKLSAIGGNRCEAEGTSPMCNDEYDPIVRVDVTMPGGCGPDADPSCLGPPSQSGSFLIGLGKAADVFGTILTFADVKNNTAIFKIDFTATDTIQLVNLNEKFQLSQGTSAQITDYKNMKITFTGVKTLECLVAPCPTSIQLAVSLPGELYPAKPIPVVKPITVERTKTATTTEESSTGAVKPSSTEGNSGAGTVEPVVIISISTGEKQNIFGATINFLDYTDGVATMVVSVDKETKLKTPICNKIGTDAEGWYVEDNLVKLATCACRAVCKEIGTPSEGYYSSCTGEVLSYGVCSSGEGFDTTVNRKQVQIKQDTGSGFVKITSDETAITKEKLTVNKNSISISTAAGEKAIGYLPEEAKQAAQETSQNLVISQIELKQENDRPFYEVTGTKKEYFLWVFPYDTSIKVNVDAQTNKVLSIEKATQPAAVSYKP